MIHSRLFCLLLLASNLLISQIYAQTLIAPSSGLNWLGRGFDAQSKFTKQSCLTGEWTIEGNKKIDIFFQNNLSSEERIQISSGSVGAGVNLIIFGGSVRSSMYHRISENKRTASSTLRVHYVSESITLDNRAYTELGKSMLHESKAKRREVCGNQFLHHVNLGTDLYVAANLHFKTEEEYKRFKTRIKIRFLFWSKTKTIIKEFKKYAENGIFSIKVVEPGGTNTQLNNILNQHPLYCKTSHIEDCFLTLDLIFQYLFSPGGYASDLTPENLKILSWDTTDYVKSGHFGLDTDLFPNENAEYFLQEQRLLLELQTNSELKELLLALIHTEPENQGIYEYKLELVQENLQQLDYAIQVCKEEPPIETCRQATDYSLNALHPIDI